MRLKSTLCDCLVLVDGGRGRVEGGHARVAVTVHTRFRRFLVTKPSLTYLG